MQLKSTTSHKFKLLLILIFISDFVLAQAPTVTSFSPTIVTRRTEITILGSNFTSNSTVSFGGTVAFAVTYVNSSKLIAVVNTGSGGTVTVTNSSGSGSLGGLTYIAPVSPSGSSVTSVITDWGGYWNSSSASADQSQQPDTQHNLLAFQNNGTLYSTGVNNTTLSGNNISYTPGDFRALPVSSITGTTAASNYIALGNKIDGNAAATDYLSPAVNGLTVQDVLIDGTNGLGLGSGVTNINSNAVLLFTVDDITNNQINDSQPDILITQIADPTQSAFDIFCFVDVAGNIIGNPVQANFYNVPAVGTYKLDLFTLATGQPYTTVTPSANGAAGGNTRDIRMLAFKLSDFGISPSNSNSVFKLKYMPSGNSDPAFMAYNAGAVSIPAPVITQQPLSQVICPGEGNITFSVTATGSELTYQWRKNSVTIPGATASTYTINDPQESDVAAYSVVVTNPSGSVVSNIVYLNTIISLQPQSASTCINSSHTISFTSNGASLTYQWYSNTSLNNTGGTIISGATNSFYQPPVTTPGTYYYYCVITNNGLGCAGAITDAVAFTVYAAPVAGTPSSNIAVCEGSTTTVSVSGTTGNIQWQQSLNNSSWNNIDGATSATYETPALSQTTYYRARVTSGSCTAATSATITVTVTSVPVAGTISGTQEICPGTTADLNLNGYNGNIQWQQSASGTDGWINVTGGVHPTEAGYTSAAITETTHYRAVVTNGGCEEISGTVTVTVRPNNWTGTISSDWHTAGNWECSAVPDEGHTVVVPQAVNYPVIAEGQAFSKTITIEEGAALTIATGNSLTVAAGISVDPTASFTIEDNANLIQAEDVANTGNITLHKNSLGLFRLDYTFWSSPVAGQQLYAFSPNTQITPQSRFYTYNTAASSFASLDPFTTTFESGKGYLIRMPNEDTAPGYNAGETPIVFEGVFTGVPNNGTITAPVSTEGARFNAVGNPYPSPISVRDFFLENEEALEPGEPIYFWRKKNNANATSYAVLTLAGFVSNTAIGGNEGEEQFGGGQWSAYFNEQANTDWVIRQGQGFIIKTGELAENIVFKNSMRRDEYNTAFFRMDNNAISRFWLDITNSENEFSQTAVVYTEEGTLGIDFGYDGKRAVSGSLCLFSQSGEDTFAIQARPAFENTDVVPVGYKAGTEGEYTIEISRKDGVFAEGQKIYLRDLEAGITHNLTEEPYTFATGAGTFNNRFEIVYAGDELSLETATALPGITIMKNFNSIKVSSHNQILKNISIFDIRGRVLYNAADINAFTATIQNLNIEKQVLIVQATTIDNKIFNTKIVY